MIVHVKDYTPCNNPLRRVTLNINSISTVKHVHDQNYYHLLVCFIRRLAEYCVIIRFYESNHRKYYMKNLCTIYS